MAYETLSVRMSRSNPTISWGLTLRGSGSDIIVNTVEKESLADKAAIQPNDKVVEFGIYKTPSLTLNKANAILMEPLSEIKFVLNRYITSHPSLPWNLTDKENKIVIDQVNPPKSQSTYNSRSFNENLNSSQITTSLSRPAALGYEPTPFKSPTSTSGYEEHVIHKREGYQNEYNTSSYTKKETFTTDGYKPAPFTTSFPAPTQADTISSFGASVQENRPLEQPQNPKSFVQTNITRSVPIQNNVSKIYKASFPSAKQTAAAFNQPQYQQGSKTSIYYSPRHVRQLSPTASIQYLHSNPTNVSYAYETPAEEYLRKTGGLFGTDRNLSKINRTPYLTSETRRLIAEEESGLGRSASPAQSGSFKRISKAVGTPVS